MSLTTRLCTMSIRELSSSLYLLNLLSFAKALGYRRFNQIFSSMLDIDFLSEFNTQISLTSLKASLKSALIGCKGRLVRIGWN